MSIDDFYIKKKAVRFEDMWKSYIEDNDDIYEWDKRSKDMAIFFFKAGYVFRENSPKAKETNNE